VDWRAYHAINDFVWRHHWLGTVFREIESYGVIVFALAAFVLWFLDRPGAPRHWKLASGSALASAAIALLANKLIAAAWHRDRPYETHPASHVFGVRKHDASFPSDHSSAAFAIAFGVFLVDRVAGAFFLAGAVLIGVGRVIVGAHYPLDAVAGLFVGLGAAVIVVRVALPLVDRIARVLERVTDPLLAPLWRRGARD
jgi:undecaprenyl-diphosphatase